MKKAFLFSIIVLFIFVPFSVFSQTVDEIIAKNLQSKGGIDKLKAIKSIKMTGKFVTQGMEFPFVLYLKRPNLMRNENDFQGQKIISIYDGEKAWQINPLLGSGEPIELTGVQADSVKEKADIDGPFVDYKEKGIKIELLGKENVDGTSAYKLKVINKHGKEKFYYLEVNSCLEIKAESTFEFQGNNYTSITTISDYKDVDGVKFPFSVHVSSAIGSLQFIFEVIELNPALEDSLFKISK